VGRLGPQAAGVSRRQRHENPSPRQARPRDSALGGGPSVLLTKRPQPPMAVDILSHALGSSARGRDVALPKPCERLAEAGPAGHAAGVHYGKLDLIGRPDRIREPTLPM
jgi:hypothetical protein